jgi:DNA-binding Lrp family transcriptional regulator
MNLRTSKALYKISNNSRITTKELGKAINSSQQSASYLLSQLKTKGMIRFSNAVVDPIRLGLINIIVGIDFLTIDKRKREGAMKILKDTEEIIGLQRANHGVDLVVEYCTKNLSLFNKIHQKINHELHDCIETRFIFPVIVKHKYAKSYLVKKPKEQDIVTCGDREQKNISENERKVLLELIENPDASFTAIAKKTRISPPAIVRIKKKLEKDKVLRGFSCTLGYNKLKINREVIYLSFSSREAKEIERFREYAKNNKNIVELVKIIGKYQAYIVVESKEKIDIMPKLRAIFHINDYLVVDIAKVIKAKYCPNNF